MARLASQEKMGYYPTPEEELEKIMSKIKVTGSISVLDPCFGDGRALKAFKERFNSQTYGVELSPERYDTAVGENFVDNPFNVDALNEIVANKYSFDVLFLNPPYDNDFMEDNFMLKKRIETRFLEKYVPAIKENGILIYIVPKNSIINDYTFLSREFLEVALYSFEDQAYKQWVFIGIRKKKRVNYKEIEQKTKYIKYLDFDSAVSELISLPYQNTATRENPIKMFSTKITYEQMASQITDELSNLFLDTTKLRENVVCPVTEPREGHLALLTASGLINGSLDDGTKIKGTVYNEKTTITEYTEDGDVEIERMVSVPKIKIFMLKDNTLREVY